MKYIIVAYQIINMGGAQQYYRNKAETLKNMGYDVFIFSSDRGDIVIKELKQYEYGIIQELKYPVYCFGDKRIEAIIECMSHKIGEADRSTIIESSSIAAAQWGELLAERIGCKHFLFNLLETHSYTQSEIEFLKFKLDRNELFGITKQSVKLMFNEFYDIQNSESYHFSAHCTNVIEDMDSDIPMNLPKAMFNIGSLGRLDKRFVYPALCQLKNFILDNPKSSFNVILIGGSTNNNDIKRIKQLFASIDNTNLFITGYMYPVPRKLVKKVDVFFSSAGSSRVTVREQIPTIAMSADTGNPIGILNYTTKDTLYGECEYSFTELLRMILFDNYCLKHVALDTPTRSDSLDYAPEVERQLKLISKNEDYRYYSVCLLRPESKKYKLYFIFGRIFGAKVLDIGRSVLHKLR